MPLPRQMMQVIGPQGTYPHETQNVGLEGLGISNKVLTVGLVAVRIPAPIGDPSNLTNRAAIVIQACYSNTKKIYLGANTVTADEGPNGGIALAAGQIWPLQLRDGAEIWAVSDAAAQHVAILQVDRVVL